MSQINNKRIAKNTLLLYSRQAIAMLIGLYTTRVILDVLGIEDYGLYNVIAGVVGMFSFLSGSMAGATQRYFSFELGNRNFKQLKKLFGISLVIYGLIGVGILLLSETIGLWFVHNNLTIPTKRMEAVLWIYQFSILAFIASVLTIPYKAAVISHEDLNIYACLSIMEVFLKLGIVLILRYLPLDKLQLYGIFMFAITFINMAIYVIICRQKYSECSFGLYWNKNLLKEITSYTGWNFFGTFAYISKNQVITIILNQFFNPVVVSARSIAASLSACTASFSRGFTTALNPQIVKTYAAKQYDGMFSLVFQGSKAAYFLMYLITLPAFLEMPVLLSVWLKNVPEYAIVFTRLTLLDILIESISYPIETLVGATGKIKLYQSVTGGILLLNLPVSWVALYWGAPPYSVMIISVILSFVALIFRLFIVKMLIAFPIRQFIKEVIFPVFGISILSAIILICIQNGLNQGFLRLCLITLLSVLFSCGCMYLFGLTRVEKKKIQKIIINAISKKGKKTFHH